MTPDDLRYLLRRPIAFHRAFAEIAKGATSGLFLSQLFYWSDKGDDPEGWIYKTIEQWQEETALTRSEQERARKILSELGLLEVERRGLPARLFFRLDVNRLASLLDAAIKSAGSAQTSLPDAAIKDARSRDLSSIPETTPETTQTGQLHSIDRLQRAVGKRGLGR